MVSGTAFYMHNVIFGFYFICLGFSLLVTSVYRWFSDIINEATYSGYHTKAVRMGLRLGFLLFIVSEIMLFFGFFWAFFHSSLSPSLEIGLIFPPIGLNTINVFDYPLFNTFVLIISGSSITWSHCAVSLAVLKAGLDSLFLTVGLGSFFIYLQMYEYFEAFFTFADSVYGCCFYMLTGLHGCHVFAGTVFIFVCLLRLLLRHYIITHYLGLVFSIWYWHFVDIVWIFLFFTVYMWGSL
jgi:cytochrome c oxidase subunit 3